MTEAHLCDWEVILASVALDQVEVGPDLPIDFLPRNSISFSDESYKFLEVPIPVDHMLGPHLAVGVNEGGALATREHLPLLLGEQFVAVGALM